MSTGPCRGEGKAGSLTGAALSPSDTAPRVDAGDRENLRRAHDALSRVWQLPDPRGPRTLQLGRLLARRAAVTPSMLRHEVLAAVDVVVAEIPFLPRQDAIATPRAVDESRLDHRAQDSPACPMRRPVSAPFPRFHARSHLSRSIARNRALGGGVFPLREVDASSSRERTRALSSERSSVRRSCPRPAREQSSAPGPATSLGRWLHDERREGHPAVHHGRGTS
jgi:hypothetical protein